MPDSLIHDLAAEVEGEPKALESFGRQRFPSAPKGSIFVGAGDSYAAALAGFFVSGGRCVSLDPYVLASAPEMADGEEVYFISVSGRTTSNALAAEKVRGRAKRTTALTAVTESRLGRLTDRVVRLPMAYLSRIPGVLSFSLSLLAVLRIVGSDATCDFSGALEEARKERLRFSERGTTYFLGNSAAYPAALYAAAKVYEILGARAHAEFLEEFSHLELFSMDKSDSVNSFAAFDPAGIAGRLSRALEEQGYESHRVRSWGRSSSEQLFHSVFQVQLSVLAEARERGLASPRFLSVPGALHASDSMIY